MQKVKITFIHLAMLLFGLVMLFFAAWFSQLYYRTYALSSDHIITQYKAQGDELRHALKLYRDKHGTWPTHFELTGRELPYTLLGRWRYNITDICEFELKVGGSGIMMNGLLLGWCERNRGNSYESESAWDIADM